MISTFSMSLSENKLEINNRSDSIVVLLPFIIAFIIDFTYFLNYYNKENLDLNWLLISSLTESILLMIFLFPLLIILCIILYVSITINFTLIHFDDELRPDRLFKKFMIFIIPLTSKEIKLKFFDDILIVSNIRNNITLELPGINSTKTLTLAKVHSFNSVDSTIISGESLSFWLNALSKFFIIKNEIEEKEVVLTSKESTLLYHDFDNDQYSKSIQNLKLVHMLEERDDILSFLRTRNLLIEDEGLFSENFIGFIKASRNDLKLFIGKNENTDTNLEIHFETQIQFNQGFRLTKDAQNFSSNSLYLRNNYISDFSLHSLNVEETISFIESNNIFYELSRLCKNSNQLSFSGQILSITVEQSLDPILLLDNLKILFSILDIFNASLPKTVDKNTKFVANYHCLQCQNKIEMRGETCHHCGALLPRCIICWKDPEPLEKIVMLQCCGFYAHENHLRDWLKIHDKCPICGLQHPKSMDVNIE